jgi:hypothetical protein
MGKSEFNELKMHGLPDIWIMGYRYDAEMDGVIEAPNPAVDGDQLNPADAGDGGDPDTLEARPG